jgi:hypothetical protein
VPGDQPRARILTNSATLRRNAQLQSRTLPIRPAADGNSAASLVELVGPQIRRRIANLAVDVLGRFRPRLTRIDDLRHRAAQMQIAGRRIAEHRGEIADRVVAQQNLVRRFDARRRTAQQIVGDDQAAVVVDQPDQTFQPRTGIVDRVVQDAAVFGIVRQDPVFRAADDEIVAHDAPAAMQVDVGRSMGIAQADARVAIENDVAFDDAILGIVPQEDGAPASPVRPRMPTNTLSEIVQRRANITSIPPT